MDGAAVAQPNAQSISADKLPEDWYERFGARMLRESVRSLWEIWPDWHQTFKICREPYAFYSPWENTGESSIDGPLPKEYGLSESYHFFNKSAVLYLVRGPPPAQEAGGVFDYCNDWLARSYETWQQECSPAERLDDRFAFAPFNLRSDFTGTKELSKDIKELGQAIGLGGVPQAPLKGIICKLMAFHDRNCDLVQAKAQALKPASVAKSDLESWTAYSFESWMAYSTLPPTARAVLLIGRNPMPKSTNVLLVLTGRNQDKKSGPPTFKFITRDDIVRIRAKNIIEVTLETAVKYLRLLERREEAANEFFRARNDARREAVYQECVQRSRYMLEDTHKSYLKKGQDFDIKWNCDVGMNFAWKWVVEDERYLETLESSRTLRQAAHAWPGHERSTRGRRKLCSR